MRRAHVSLKRTMQEQNGGMQKKARGDDYVTNEETLSDLEEGEIPECDEGHEKVVDHDAECEHDNVEEEEPEGTVSAAFAKYAAGELKGRIANADTYKRSVIRTSIAEENASSDEQRIIGEDDVFWGDRYMLITTRMMHG